MGRFLQKFAQISLLKNYRQKSNAFLTDLDTDTGTYSSNWSVFYTGATQIEKILKNVFEDFGGFLGKIVVKTRGLLQPCTGRYTQFWHILAKQTTKNCRFPPHNSRPGYNIRKIRQTHAKPPICATNSTKTRLFVHFRPCHDNNIRSRAATNAFFLQERHKK